MFTVHIFVIDWQMRKYKRCDDDAQPAEEEPGAFAPPDDELDERAQGSLDGDASNDGNENVDDAPGNDIWAIPPRILQAPAPAPAPAPEPEPAPAPAQAPAPA